MKVNKVRLAKALNVSLLLTTPNASSPDAALRDVPDQHRDTPATEVETIVFGMRGFTPQILLGIVVGLLLFLTPLVVPAFAAFGLQAIAPLFGVCCIVFSLFGDLPRWIAWTQRLGAWLYPGIALGTFLILIPLLIPHAGHESSFWAFSPRVWLAYLVIVLVSISFELSSLPTRIYWLFQARTLNPVIVVPVYVLVAGLLGNVLDGVTIIAISVVIFRRLLAPRWALQASFALLFGGLLSNFMTVAAEPTNIKFQDVLAPILDHVRPSYWLTNWPISLCAILLPVIFLAVTMARHQVTWLTSESTVDGTVETAEPAHRYEHLAALLAIALLAAGILAHSVIQFLFSSTGRAAEPPSLGLFLLPAGVAALWHLLIARRPVQQTTQVHFALPFPARSVVHHSRLPTTWKHIQLEAPVWIKLGVIFSLLWYIANGLAEPRNIFAAFFFLPESWRLGIMSLLSLASSVTDNVALAAMQGSLLLQHPLPTWQIRFLFILLTWAGGFTPFGCLQSLALNSRLHLSTSAWFRHTFAWAALSLIGALMGLVLLNIWYPLASGLR